MTAFEVPRSWRRVETIDAHVAGEPLRVVTAGYPPLEGATMLERRRFARERCDDLRRALMLEPRGHADMYGCVLTPPATPDGDVGVLFLHNEGYSTMCGHGIVGLVKVGLESRLFSPVSPPLVRIDTPAGRVTATAHVDGGRVARVSFLNVPSFVLARDLAVDVPGLGAVTCDVAYGGAFYAFVGARSIDLALEPPGFARIVELGVLIKQAVSAALAIEHPAGDPDLGFLYGTIFHAPPTPGAAADVHSRHVCVFAAGEVDRSPTGTGVSARAALLAARGELELGRTITIDSLIGTRFDVRAVETTRCGELSAIVPEVTGSAFVTGRHEFLLDPDDPLLEGFLLR